MAQEIDTLLAQMQRPVASGSRYVTSLSPASEAKFRAWVRRSRIPFDPGAEADYDMRGFWKAMSSGDPRARSEVNPSDGLPHFPDVWKTPFHKTFSSESIYAPADAPRWIGQRLIDKNGRVIADESPIVPGMERLGALPGIPATRLTKQIRGK